jgi:molecular chaperone DnaK
MAMSRLREAVEVAKKALSADRETTISLPFLANDRQGAQIDYQNKITRAWVEQLTRDLLDRLEQPCRRALADAGLAASDLEEVLLVGGMTRWPAVPETVERLFGKKPSKGVNPDEVVALGAATYAGILAGDSDEAQLLDVTPHDIGIKIGDSQFAVVLPRNSMLPVRARRLFATTSEDQRFVAIELYQGDSQDISKNRKLGQVILDELPRGPAGSVRVELAITVNVESILSATAREIKTGKVASVTIRPSGGLSQREIVEIITRRRQDHAAGKIPLETGSVRMTARDQLVSNLGDDETRK